MADKQKTKKTGEPEAPQEETKETVKEPAQEPVKEAAQEPELPQPTREQQLQEKLDAEHDAHLRLAAEYDNFRKRTQKEKDASYANGKADTIGKLLPIYDNLARALEQPTEDAAYKKGVEMTMTELEKIFAGMGVTAFGAVGETFDPNLHNAVMHTEDESLGENVIAQVFQKGFQVGDKVIRFAMVQVAN